MKVKDVALHFDHFSKSYLLLHFWWIEIFFEVIFHFRENKLELQSLLIFVQYPLPCIA